MFCARRENLGRCLKEIPLAMVRETSQLLAANTQGVMVDVLRTPRESGPLS
jgi:hypothetical protein